MGHSEEFWQNAVHWRRNSNQLQCSFLENPRGSVLVLSLFICWVVSTSLQPNELWYTSLPYPSLSPGVCSNSSLLSQWCYPNISSSVVPFSSCPQPFQLSESFLISQFFTLGGQSIGTSALPSVLPMNIRVDFLWHWLVWSICCLRDTQEFSPAPQFKGFDSLVLSLLYGQTLTSI